MKHLKLYETFAINEAARPGYGPGDDIIKMRGSKLIASGKEDKKLVDKLIGLAKTDPTSFVESFCEKYGSAAIDWMDSTGHKKFAKIYASGKYEFKAIGGDFKDGGVQSDPLFKKFLDSGWKILAIEDEDDLDSEALGSFCEAIIYKQK